MGNKERIVVPMWIGGREVELPQWQVNEVRKLNLPVENVPQEELLKTLILVEDTAIAVKARKALTQLELIRQHLMKDPKRHFIPSAATELNVIKTSAPLLSITKKDNGRDYKLSVGKGLLDFVKSIPKEERRHMKLRFIPKDSAEGRKILKTMKRL